MEETVSEPGPNADAARDSHSQRLTGCIDQDAFGKQDAAAVTAPFRLVFESSSQNRYHDSETHREAANSSDRERYQSHQDQSKGLRIVGEDSEHSAGDEPWREFLAFSAGASSRAAYTDTSHYNIEHGPDVGEADPYEPIGVDDCLRLLHTTLGLSDESSAAPVPPMSLIAHASAMSTSIQKSSTETQQSPSASLRRITDLARRQATEASAPDDGDDMWKKFVFGDLSSSGPESAQEGFDENVQRESYKKTQVSSSQWSLAAGARTSSERQIRLPPTMSMQGLVLSGQGEEHELVAGEEYPTASMYNNAALSERSSPANSSPRGPNQVKSTAATCETSTQDEGSSPDPITIGNIHAAVERVRTGRARPKKIVFTKPAAFVGKASESHTMRIGSKQPTRKRLKTRRRQESDSVYDIPVSDEIDDEVEDIED